MIGSEEIEKAERILQLTYSQPTLDRQLERVQVDGDAFDNLVAGLREIVRKRYPDFDPRLEPAINTLFGHGFLLGVICGRDSVQEIA